MRSKACNSLLVAYHCIVLDVVSVCGACAKSFLCFMVMLRMEKPSLVESFALYMQLKNSFTTQVFPVWTCFYKLATKMHCSSDLHLQDLQYSRSQSFSVIASREAARECRRKKKEYVKCLENRVAVLEKQNKTLIEELKALKDIYCHKTE